MIYNGVSKIRAAEEQLKRAIVLFFKNEDPISTHTLASAAQEILESLGKRQGITSLKQQVVNQADESRRGQFINAMNDAKNAFKHADRDPDGITKLNPEYTELVLWDAVNLFYKVTQQKIPAFVVYDLWIYSRYPEMRDFTPEIEKLYKDTLNGHSYQKEHFLDMISKLENELKKNIKPHEEILHFNNKNFGPPAIFLDPYTKVWNVLFPLNGERPDKAEEEVMINFYLTGVWASGESPDCMAGQIAGQMTRDKDRLIGFPFIAPDNITRKPAHFIWSFDPQKDHADVFISKVLPIEDGALSIIYRKRIMGSGKMLEENINAWLLQDLQSNFGISKEIGNTGMDESWVGYLKNKRIPQGN